MIALGTLMRHVHELMDGAVADIYAEHGLPDYRPRFSPVVRTLVAQGPLAIRDLARAIGVTHSAASQTVVQMRRSGFVTLEKGADARHRIVHLTGRARAALPLIEAEWAATERAVRELDAELPVPLEQLMRATLRALERRDFRERIGDVNA
ncbi:DNA-binding MarR family transcriptional regulator [Nonomuraea thailandensis]|uniref:DNA-binding MarR family transcriptional regulator n=1 Tax=Nonomuraea thailandensis TaxID=1188745 RepID=A0A9X2GS90_9ACTN|nr:MarR family transcriptional regulator [Nonomuraea thailandensis]MCP2363005.1 DNA-binding MarR family transcriptional regulator [Nonomuraea thailandensis]